MMTLLQTLLSVLNRRQSNQDTSQTAVGAAGNANNLHLQMMSLEQSLLSTLNQSQSNQNSSQTAGATGNTNSLYMQMMSLEPLLLNQPPSTQNCDHVQQRMMELMHSLLSALIRLQSKQDSSQTSAATAGNASNLQADMLTNAFGRLRSCSLSTPENPNELCQGLDSTELTGTREQDFLDAQENRRAAMDSLFSRPHPYLQESGPLETEF